MTCEFSRLLSQGNPQQLQIAAGAGQHLIEGLQPGGHDSAVSLDLALLLLGSLDPLTDQGCLVGTGGRERVERVALRLLRFAFAGPRPLQVLFGLGQVKTHVLLIRACPVQDLACMPHLQPGDT